ncbi:hypothetical protein KAH55_06500 [bacterium]|nr:hypothetical protein [bacterium]
MKRAKRTGCEAQIQPILGQSNTLSLPEPGDFMLNFQMLHEVKNTPTFLESSFHALKPDVIPQAVLPRRRKILDYRKSG